MKSLSFILFLSFLTFSCSLLEQLFPVSEETLALGTWNVRDFSYSGSYEAAARLVVEQSLDILLLQETQSEDLELLMEELYLAGAEIPFFVQSQESRGEDHLTILSRFPLDNVQFLHSEWAVDPHEGDWVLMEYQRPVMICSVEWGGEPLWLFCCHLDSGTSLYDQKRRRVRAAEIRNFIVENLEPQRERIVILGDLNTMGDGVDRTGGLVGPEDFTGGAMDFDMAGSVQEMGTMGLLCFNGDGIPENDFSPLNYFALPYSPTCLYQPDSYLSILDHIIVSSAFSRDGFSREVEVLTSYNRYSDHLPVIVTVYTGTS